MVPWLVSLLWKNLGSIVRKIITSPLLSHERSKKGPIWKSWIPPQNPQLHKTATFNQAAEKGSLPPNGAVPLFVRLVKLRSLDRHDMPAISVSPKSGCQNNELMAKLLMDVGDYLIILNESQYIPTVSQMKVGIRTRTHPFTGNRSSNLLLLLIWNLAER